MFSSLVVHYEIALWNIFLISIFVCSICFIFCYSLFPVPNMSLKWFQAPKLAPRNIEKFQTKTINNIFSLFSSLSCFIWASRGVEIIVLNAIHIHWIGLDWIGDWCSN